MPVRVGINGFGRIGRITFRAMHREYGSDLQVVAINDLTDAQTNAHLLKYDSNYGTFPGTVSAEERALVVDGERIQVFAEKDPAAIPWRDVGVDIVIESTGFFTDATKARAHLDAGAKKVIISAPAKNEDITIVLGVNRNGTTRPSTTSSRTPPAPRTAWRRSPKCCTTGGGIEKGLLTTIHAYTNSQKLLDLAAKDLRDARAAAMNIVPAATGAARAVGLVIPELQGQVHRDGVPRAGQHGLGDRLHGPARRRAVSVTRSTPRCERRPKVR